jgi:hypothetical protein
MIEHLEEDWHLTGNEDDCSYTYIIKNNCYQFYKCITFNLEEDYDIYQESFAFETYRFTIGKYIPKVSTKKLKDKTITMDFVRNFKCDFQNENYCVRYKYSRERPIVFIPPSDVLKTHSQQLYDKYV